LFQPPSVRAIPSATVRILHVNKFLYRRGGAEGYMLDVAAMQEAAGHDVAFFAMRHPENLSAPYERWFPAQVDFDPPPADLGGRLRGAGRLLWSTSASRGMDAVLADFRPDVVHLHNIYHQLSPSILQPVRRRQIPAVMTLHDYKLACPTYQFMDHGEICEACLPHRFWEPIARRCNGGSLAASALNAVEMTLHTFGRAYGPVGIFACPSRFLLGKMQEGRVFPDRLRWIPNFVDLEAFSPKQSPGGDVVFAGRLSMEKGVDVLVEAVASRPDLRLNVAGDGPARPALERLAADRGAADRITFHGRLATEALQELLRSSSVAAVPSRWYENMPLAVLEAFASGLPVVGTDLGGVPELIEPGVDGAIVPPNDPGVLGDALASLVSDPDAAMEMGRNARAKAEREYSPAVHLERLDALYLEARARSRGAA
jgi:glycosyltransferase involved in cell wall biosynthesis